MIKRRSVFAGIGIFTLLQLVGCSTVNIEPDLRFATYGRFTLVLTDQSGKYETLSGKFSFRRTDAYSRLDLLTPLNGVLARIELRDGMASLSRDLSDEPITAPTAEILMERTVGFSMPVEALEEWALALDVPKGYGWKVQILKREARRPKTLRAERQISRGSIRITIVFDEVFP